MFTLKRTALSLACILLLLPVVFVAFQQQSVLKDEDSPEFYFTRLIYSEGFSGGRFGSWATDYPEADYKFMWGVQRMTKIRVFPDPHEVRIMDPELFKFPYLYAVEVGRGMTFSSQEAARLREYLLRGGFWHVDDFWGPDQFRNFYNQIQKVFPDRPLVELPLTHEVFHTHFEVTEVMQIPNVNNGCRGAQTWQDARDIKPRVFGISDDDGRLMVMVTYNSDLGDAWEWMDEPCYPALYSGQAYRMGINFLVYAMTH